MFSLQTNNSLNHFPYVVIDKNSNIVLSNSFFDKIFPNSLDFFSLISSIPIKFEKSFFFKKKIEQKQYLVFIQHCSFGVSYVFYPSSFPFLGHFIKNSMFNNMTLFFQQKYIDFISEQKNIFIDYFKEEKNPIVLVDEKNSILFYNEYFKKILQSPYENLLGQNFISFFSDIMLSDNQSDQFEYHFLDKLYQIKSHPFFSSQKKYFILSFSDITEQHEEEKKILSFIPEHSFEKIQSFSFHSSNLFHQNLSSQLIYEKEKILSIFNQNIKYFQMMFPTSNLNLSDDSSLTFDKYCQMSFDFFNTYQNFKLSFSSLSTQILKNYQNDYQFFSKIKETNEFIHSFSQNFQKNSSLIYKEQKGFFSYIQQNLSFDKNIDVSLTEITTSFQKIKENLNLMFQQNLFFKRTLQKYLSNSFENQTNLYQHLKSYSSLYDYFSVQISEMDKYISSISSLLEQKNALQIPILHSIKNQKENIRYNISLQQKFVSNLYSFSSYLNQSSFVLEKENISQNLIKLDNFL